MCNSGIFSVMFPLCNGPKDVSDAGPTAVPAPGFCMLPLSFQLFAPTQTLVFFFQKPSNFMDKLHESVWVVLCGSLLAENAPVLARFNLHRK